MNRLNPIYTEKTECQDCYKCVRQCPVKAIKIKDGSAQIISEDCILCGHCVEVCPVEAKKVRDDLSRVKQLLTIKKQVFVSIAPSYISEFGINNEEKIIYALKKLGFAGVSETALGAQEVSAHAALYAEQADPGIMISSACPVIVNFIKKEKQNFTSKITPFLSPALSHASMLKQKFGNDISIVFISPCIGKKQEADDHPDLIDIAITFNELRNWFKEEKIDIQTITTDGENKFIPEKAAEGSLYPIDGGMIAGMKKNIGLNDISFMTFSGLENIKNCLEDIDQLPKDSKIFLELLACEGGCINGPQGNSQRGTISKRVNVINNVNYNESNIPRKANINISQNYENSQTNLQNYSEAEIKKALALTGKLSTKDELNCSGCGYESCRDFAIALLTGQAEKEMCVSYLRKMAQKKANMLIKAMPAGLVIVNKEMRIIECNKKFAELLGTDLINAFNAKPGLEDGNLKKIIPNEKFIEHCQLVLDIGEKIKNRHFHFNKAIFDLSVFPIEKKQTIGIIIQDITNPSYQKEQIVFKAKEVTKKSLETVQKIAYLLGENASETEVILNSIIETIDPSSLENREENNE